MRWISIALVSVALAAGVAACGDEGDADPCGTSAPGNDFGVGMACTPGGGECADTPGRMAPFCTGDQRPDADWFCTRPCDPTMDSVPQCGEGSVCENEGGSGPSGCLLAICL